MRVVAEVALRDDEVADLNLYLGDDRSHAFDRDFQAIGGQALNVQGNSIAGHGKRFLEGLALSHDAG